MQKIKIKDFIGRLDKFLVSEFSNFSRSKVNKMIERGFVLVNGELVKAGYSLKKGDEIFIKDFFSEKQELKYEKMDLDILYEDKSCLVINKPAGISVHPGEGEFDNQKTILHGLLNKINQKDFDKNRAGIFHRLDKNTSGALVVAKNIDSYKNLVQQFKNHKVKKTYIALVKGKMEYNEGIIDSPIGRSLRDRKKMAVVSLREGKNALTKYKVKKVFPLLGGIYKEEEKNFGSLLEIHLETGRTHQIRVHFSSIGHCVVGDTSYGDKKLNNYFKEKFGLDRQFLHAWKLSFVSPERNKKVQIVADFPDNLKNIYLF